MVPELIWPVEALLGEGPAWFPEEGALRFVDIKRGQIHRFVPGTGQRDSIATGGAPSFIVGSADGGLLAGSGSAIHRVTAEGFGEPVVRIDQPVHNRTNDATVDGQGRLWFGTMDNEETRATGVLHCLEQAALHALGHGAVVTNGPAVTADGRTLYFVDSGSRTILRLTIGEGPSIVAKEPFVQLAETDGHPDGIVLDSEECLWVALWDGWGVRRYAPDGTLLAHVDFPCARVTKLAFGGRDLRTAYVTTARIGLNDAALAAQPLAGGLFAFTAPAPGRVLPKVRLA